MKRFGLSLVFLFSALLVTLTALAQLDNLIAMPNVLPPTPNAAAITKPEQVSLGKFTGTAQFTIPLYSISYRDVNIPISINYSSNGVKVDQLASRVGIDWSLEAGGVITRTVMHEDDEKKNRQKPPNSLTNLTELAEYVYPFFMFENEGYMDTQADEFAYSAAGLTGKFILDTAKNVVQITISENKIEKHINFGISAIPWDFKITNGLGVKYYFGGEGARDKSKSESEGCGRNKYDVEATVAYYLNKIEYPNGDLVTFIYDALPMYVYYTGVMESVVRMYPSQYTNCGSAEKNVICQVDPSSAACACYPFGETPISTPATACPIKITTNSVILSEIVTSDGTSAKFYYSSRLDQVGEKKYDSLVISKNSTLVKRLGFLYDFSSAGTYFTGNFYNSANIPYEYKRMFLAEVLLKPIDYSGSLRRYEFTYDDINGLPPRLSSAQDHFGYFNGEKNFFYIPTISDELNQFSMITQAVSFEAKQLFAGQGGNREPNSTYSKKGSLLRIKYPTGGSTEIDWEPNSVSRNIVNYPSEQSYTIGAVGTGLSGSVTALSANMTLNYDQKIKIEAAAYELSGYDPLHNSVEVSLKTLGGTVLYTKIIKGGETLSTKVGVAGGQTYRLQIISYGAGISGSASSFFRPGDTTHQLMNIEMPGLRVKRLREIDGAGDTLIRRYYYTKVEDTLTSSGVSVNMAYFNDFDVHKWCWDDCFETYIGPIHMAKVSSSPLFALNLYGQNPVNYPYVVESIGESFAGGCTESKYTIQLDGSAQVLYGQDIYNTPRSNNGFMTGTLERERIFKISSNVLTPVKFTRFVYSFDSRNFSWMNNLVLFQKEQPPFYSSTGPTDHAILRFFDIQSYPRYSYWIHLDSTITELYDDLGASMIATKESTQYGSTLHLQPTEINSLDSKGNLHRNIFRYPHDSVATGNVYDTMVKRNMIVHWLEHKGKVNSSDLITYRRSFDFNWFPDKRLVAVKKIDVQSGSSNSETRVRYEKYSPLGSVISARKEKGQLMTYVWDPQTGRVLAEVVNAADSDVAFTSFETEAKGNWSYTGTVLNDGQTRSGFKAYSLSIGTSILKTDLNSIQTYIVSYWTKNSTPYTVTGTISGYPVSGQTINGWKFYKHVVSGVTQVYVAGSGLIDELRLYPESAMMTSYCYEPSGDIRSMCDANSNFLLYQYDGFNNLLLVRDKDLSVIKKYCYSYAGTESNCLIYSSVEMTSSFTRNDCASGYSGTTVSYTIPAGKYVSIYSQQDANQKSLAELNAFGQSFANSAGQCFIGCSSPLCVGPDKKCIGGRCETGIKVVTSSVQVGSHLWECTYHFEWSDGSWSGNYTEQSPTNCGMTEV